MTSEDIKHQLIIINKLDKPTLIKKAGRREGGGVGVGKGGGGGGAKPAGKHRHILSGIDTEVTNWVRDDFAFAADVRRPVTETHLTDWFDSTDTLNEATYMGFYMIYIFIHSNGHSDTLSTSRQINKTHNGWSWARMRGLTVTDKAGIKCLSPECLGVNGRQLCASGLLFGSEKISVTLVQGLI